MRYYILIPNKPKRKFIFLSQDINNRYVRAWRDGYKVIEITVEMRLFIISITELPKYVNNDDTHIMVEL